MARMSPAVGAGLALLARRLGGQDALAASPPLLAMETRPYCVLGERRPSKDMSLLSSSDACVMYVWGLSLRCLDNICPW